MKKYPTVTIRIDRDLLERLDLAVAKMNYKSRSRYIIDALKWQIQEDEEPYCGKTITIT